MPSGRQNRQRQPGVSSDFISEVEDKRTAAFIKKVLCAGSERKNVDDTPLEVLLPPLTSSNELDLQLYAFIAVIISENVDPWYTKITSDRGFVQEVIQVVAHCTRALEQRLRKVGVAELILNDISGLLQAHIEAWRYAKRASLDPSSSFDAEEIYHTLRPHVALSYAYDKVPEHAPQLAQDSSYRQLLAEGVLAVLLPVEDLQNRCLFALVSDVLADFVFGTLIADRFSNHRQLFTTVLDVIEATQLDTNTSSWVDGISRDEGLKADVSSPGNRVTSSTSKQTAASVKLRWLLALCMAITSGLAVLLRMVRTLIVACLSTSALPQRPLGLLVDVQDPRKIESLGEKPRTEPGLQLRVPEGDTGMRVVAPIPVLSFNLWSTLACLTRANERLRWLSNTASYIKHLALGGPGRVGSTNAPLDRILAFHLLAPFRDPALLPSILRRARATIFPGNASARPTDPHAPDRATLATPGHVHIADEPAEAEAIASSRRQAALAILHCIPRSLAKFYYGATSTKQDERERWKEEDEYMCKMVEDEILGPFESAYANRHLVYGIMELVIGALVEELRADTSDGASGSIAKLLEERGVSFDDDEQS